MIEQLNFLDLAEPLKSKSEHLHFAVFAFEGWNMEGVARRIDGDRLVQCKSLLLNEYLSKATS